MAPHHRAEIEYRERGTGDKDLSDLLQRACHDLKTSLRAIEAHAQLLGRNRQPVDPPVMEQHLEFIAGGAARIGQITDGLVSYAIALQIEPAAFQLISMEVLLRTALAKHRGELREHGAEVTNGELPRVAGNPDRLTQIFEILVLNSVRHHSGAARIHITAGKSGEHWLFAVRDDGPGIDRNHLETIFKPFKRWDSNGAKGVGMGLTICRAIVERHGGEMWAESETGKGAVFFFTLPADRGA